MIDLIRAKKAFKDYVKKYNIEDDKIRLKVAHIERTSMIAKEIAQSLNLSQEEVELAELIGLLHDIGRFEQIKQYHTFSDKDSVNHGEYGVKILFEEGKIRNFIEDSQYDEIIKKAILNHNKTNIENGLNKRELLHTKIVRDADKLDIFYILTIDEIKTIYETKDISKEEITDEIYQEFICDRKINYSKMKTSADKVVSHFAYVFDLYFEYSIRYIYEKQYLKKNYERIKFKNRETTKKLDKIYKIANEFIENKLKTGE